MSSIHLDVSVVICTYAESRWEALLAAVDSLRRQTQTPREMIVVVDHNHALFERARTALPDALVIESKGHPGLSGARNTGLAQAEGALIAFLDDDAAAEPDWLERLAAWCAEPDVVGAGGRVEPNWLAPRPTWFPEEFGWVLGCTYRGLPETARAVRNVFGGCMCVRREIFGLTGGFNDGMGRVNAIPLGCEETELCIRASQRWPAALFIYDPAAVIHHQVPAARLTWSYFLRRCFSEGASKAVLSRLVGASAGLAAERSYSLRVLPVGVARHLLDAARNGTPAGVARAAAIMAGWLTAVIGYGATVFAPGKLQGRRGTPTQNDERLGAPQVDMRSRP